MSRIVHLSDVHFGRTDPAIVAAVLAVVGASTRTSWPSPAISRSGREAGSSARRGHSSTPCPVPQLVVPGNHDVPLYNVARRFLDPLGNYRRYITTNLRPVHTDQEIRGRRPQHHALVHGEGRHDPAAGSAPRRRGARAAPARTAVKIVVAHHPFEYPDDASTRWQKAAVIRALRRSRARGPTCS